MRSLVLLCVLLMAICAADKKTSVSKENEAAMKVAMMKFLDMKAGVFKEIIEDMGYPITPPQWTTLLYYNRERLIEFCRSFLALSKKIILLGGNKLNKANFARMGRILGWKSQWAVRQRQWGMVRVSRRHTSTAIAKRIVAMKVADLPCN
uniref:Egg-lysin n=1 Tax=Haliotis kamtschatkana assimilis TaxID=556495 RepID=Q25012_HALKA|nr:fertilization protein [Haliotis kamtschatkana assimilis]prf//2113425C fusagenic protein [Haliotis kamtschatkana assimilis]